jgi:ABC-type lipoprotein release transport system permease subunit
MTFFRLLLASLTYHRRINLAVALGAAAATAVLTGALVVGDSMRGSLRDMVVERLGKIDDVLVTDRLFRAELAQEVRAAMSNQSDEKHPPIVEPALLIAGNVEQADTHRRATQVNLFGTTPKFWDFSASAASEIRPEHVPGDGEAVLNEPLAAELGIDRAQIGAAEILVRLPRFQNVPAESALGRKTETVDMVRLRVVDIIPARGLGRFDLRAGQQEPRNAYVSLGTLQSALKQPGKVNALLVADGSASQSDALAAALAEKVQLHDDLGLTVKLVEQKFQGKVVHRYIDLSSDRMMIPPAVERAALSAWKDRRPQPALAYLATWIRADAAGKRAAIPYSVISAIDSQDAAHAGGDALGPLDTDVNGKPIGPLAADEIVLNRWAADDLREQGADLKPGDAIAIDYFEPESTHGQAIERTATFKLKAIAPLSERNAAPRRTNDPGLTPEVPGVTDKDSIRNWDAPFPYESKRVRPKDDDYWRRHRTTPKAFVSLAAGRKLWASRFGDATTIRVAASADAATGASGSTSADGLAAALRKQIDPAALGFEFRPVKAAGLAAAAGTTSFAGLFLGFSMFLIAAAIMLVVLLFRLGVEQRAGELGVLLATGWSARRVRRLFLAEGASVAALGSLVGVVAGVAYAGLMLAGLRTIWVDAISTPFLTLHFTPTSLAIGFASGVLMSMLAIALSLRKLGKMSVRGLLAGNAQLPRTSKHRGRLVVGIAVALGVLAVGLSLFGWQSLQGEEQAGAFFGGGAMLLAMLLMLVWRQFHRPPSARPLLAGPGALPRLAVRSAARAPARSTLTIGLVASASFLIVAVSAFRIDPSADGAGGFALFAQCDQPLYYDLNSTSGRDKLGISDEQSAALAEARTVSIRVKPGDDASCLNLYQPQHPRVLGLPQTLLERGGFAWAGSLAETDAERANPWLLLAPSKSDPADGKTNDGTVPIALDAATATYSLKLGLGDTLDLDDGQGGILAARVVALLKNSIFQGDVLMGETAFVKHFPSAGGYRMFLIDAPPGKQDATALALEAALSDFGMDVQRSDDRLRAFMSVQNTYLSTFQTLGGLGLLLGTLGLAAVQMRNMVERRGELALLQAVGFRRTTLRTMLFLESAALLVAGLAIGAIAAAVAVLPHLVGGEAAIPWLTLLATFGAILIVGALVGMVSARATLRAPILLALRGE